MELSKVIIDDFAKVTNDDRHIPQNTTLYGTIKVNGDKNYVQLDGSDLLTPCSSSVNVKDGERVMVVVGGHEAVVTGNMSSPAARIGDVDDLAGNFLTLDDSYKKFEKLATDKFVAQQAAINELVANKATIGDLNAVNADIKNLKANKADITDLNVTNASIKKLDANKANVTDLTAVNGRIDKLELNSATAEYLKAHKADIDLANVSNAWIDKGILKDGSIGTGTIQDGAITNAKIADATIEAAKIKSLNADSITAGILKTERLIITGPDGQDSIVKAINVANGVSQAESISEKIQAAAIDVADLSAFHAKLAQFDVNENYISSGKTRIDDPTAGILISTNGIGMGDGSLTGKNVSPFQAKADGSLKLTGKNATFDFNAVTGTLDMDVSSLKISSKAVVSGINKKKTTSYGNGSDGLKITFSNKTQTEGINWDYVLLFYENSNGRLNCVGKIGGKSISNRVFYIPSVEFYLFWRTDSSTDNFYGFSIDSIETVTVTSSMYTVTSDTLPTDVKKSSAIELSGDRYPESDNHGSYGNNIRKLWKYTGVSSSISGASYSLSMSDGTSIDDAFETVDPNSIKASIQSEAGKISLKVENAKKELTSQISVLEGKIDLKVEKSDLKTQISALEGKIDLKVEKNGIISAINATSEQIAISANKIKLEGLVTANDKLKINTDGSMACKDATVNGKFASVSSSPTEYSYRYNAVLIKNGELHFDITDEDGDYVYTNGPYFACPSGYSNVSGSIALKTTDGTECMIIGSNSLTLQHISIDASTSYISYNNTNHSLATLLGLN